MTANTEAASRPVYTDGYRNTVLALLLAVYTSNFIDRTIIGILGQAIKVDLQLNDTQLGLLQGFAFAVLYTTLGIPIARFAERRNRVAIISICLVIWSGFTALCGIAQNFVQLLLYRVGVGVGEAGCSPPAHSLITDYFPAKKRASALSVYAFGIPLGTMIGAISGGWIVQNFGWREAFLVVGLPGIVLALIVWLIVKEPPRGHSEEAHIITDASAQPPSTWAVAKRLFGKWSFVHMTLGVTLTSFAGYGAGAFVPPYFARVFDLNYAEIGLIFGLIAGFANGAGTIVGGFLTDWAGKRDPKWYALVPAIGLAIATPIYLAAYVQNSWPVAVAILMIPGIFHYTYLGPTFAVMHNLVEPRMRATATALLFFVLNLIALGGGPLFTGWIIDFFSTNLFAETGAAGHFTAACPGGTAPSGSSTDLVAACKNSLATGTRWGQLVTHSIYAWGALHYFLAAIWVAKDLKSATARTQVA